uniref:Uncharacterized protein n=1 Tax=Neogobius melanostomus TaxID=47308 RepID=A0A8C6WTZ9_9GOBI
PPVVCDSVSFPSFPSDALPRNTTMLTIQYTNISSITEQHLNRTLTDLRELHLFSNRIQNLGPHLLRGLPKLRALDLTDNQLSVLPADVFSHAPLESLVLKNNQIEIASDEWLAENSRLTWLDLSGNRLTKIPATLFHNKVLLPETVVCAAPPALIGRSVMSLTESEIKMVA